MRSLPRGQLVHRAILGRAVAVALGWVLALASLGGVANADGAHGVVTAANLAPRSAVQGQEGTRPLCGAAPAGHGRCFALLRTDVAAEAADAIGLDAVPPGYGPDDLQDAYALAGPAASMGAGLTVAIVAAYDLPTAEADLAVYRSQYGLPSCTSASGCFMKVDQLGGTNYPSADAGWGGEIALDIEMVSAVCPLCKYPPCRGELAGYERPWARGEHSRRAGSDCRFEQLRRVRGPLRGLHRRRVL